jgi:hypothetical protein
LILEKRSRGDIHNGGYPAVAEEGPSTGFSPRENGEDGRLMSILISGLKDR